MRSAQAWLLNCVLVPGIIVCFWFFFRKFKNFDVLIKSCFEMTHKPEQQLMVAAVPTTCLNWLSGSSTVCIFYPGLLSSKKKKVWDVFAIAILTFAWLHMNSPIRSLSREASMVWLSIGLPLTKKTYGIFHSCPLQTIWACEGTQQSASVFMIGWHTSY